MNYICGWGILASITGIAIMFSVIKHKKSVSAIKNGTYLIFSILMICLGITTAHPINQGDYAYSFVSLKRKNLISVTPLKAVLNALILALKDSAKALVALFIN